MGKALTVEGDHVDDVHNGIRKTETGTKTLNADMSVFCLGFSYIKGFA